MARVGGMVLERKGLPVICWAYVQGLGRGHSALGGYGSCTNQAAERKNRLLKEQRKDLAAALSLVRCKALPTRPSAPTGVPLKAIPP